MSDSGRCAAGIFAVRVVGAVTREAVEVSPVVGGKGLIGRFADRFGNMD